MFGYVITNPNALPKERQQRFRAVYCGLCAALRRRHGLAGSATLSYDMTFLALLLNALYEPGEQTGRERCPAHPISAHAYAVSPVMEYVADMNVALAYHKCMDNWLDDRNPLSAGEGALLRQAYRSVAREWPDKCAAIEAWLDEVHDIESRNLPEVDLPVNATGRMLGELFVYPRERAWNDELRVIGDGLGRFIYIMDAYDDLSKDIRKGRYNPLKALRDRPDFEALCKSAMTMMIADATEAFERLPVVLDADILRNVLYSGVWSKYVYLQNKRNARGKGAD
ncbi:MAG: hypothetical protein IJ769_09280 [Clostridia bacterium]|nr:hypothetical protein [Clostridia bacterium]